MVAQRHKHGRSRARHCEHGHLIQRILPELTLHYLVGRLKLSSKSAWNEIAIASKLAIVDAASESVDKLANRPVDCNRDSPNDGALCRHAANVQVSINTIRLPIVQLSTSLVDTCQLLFFDYIVAIRLMKARTSTKSISNHNFTQRFGHL